jgi:hypothetical protein
VGADFMPADPAGAAEPCLVVRAEVNGAGSGKGRIQSLFCISALLFEKVREAMTSGLFGGRSHG